MGQKKTDTIKVRVTSSMRDELDRIKDKRDVSLSETVRDLIQLGLALWVHSKRVSLHDVLREALPIIYDKEIESIMEDVVNEEGDKYTQED